MVNLAISVMTDEFSEELEKVAEYLASFDVHYIELRGLWRSNVLSMSEEIIARLKDILKTYDLKVSSISGGLLKCLPPSINPNPGDSKSISRNWKYNYSLIEPAIKTAQELNAPYIRCFGFHGAFKVPPVTEWDNWQVYREWREKITEIKTKAAAVGKTFICENEGGLNKSLEHIDRIGADNCGPGFGMLYDMANVANKYGKKGVLTEEWLTRVGKYVQFVHAKGCRQLLFSRFTSIINGPGDILRWPRVVEYFRNLPASAFAVPAPNPLFFSVETHMGGKNRWQKSAASLKNLIKLIRNE
jgi:sugar phosphate isomerase/epimerase